MLVDRAEAAVTAYLDAARESQSASKEALRKLEPRFDAAFVALDALAWFNVDEARALTARAERWDRLADTTSVVVGALALASVVTLLVGLRSRMIRALEDLHAAVSRFMAGDATARARRSAGRGRCKSSPARSTRWPSRWCGKSTTGWPSSAAWRKISGIRSR